MESQIIIDKCKSARYNSFQHRVRSPNTPTRSGRSGGTENYTGVSFFLLAVGRIGLALNPSPTANFAGVKRGT